MTRESSPILVIVVLAALGYFVFVAQKKKPADAKKEDDALAELAKKKPATPTNGFDVLNTIAGGVAPALAPVIEQGAADLRDPQSELRNGLDNLGDTLTKFATFGILGGSDRKRKAQDAMNQELNARRDAEAFAARVHQLLSRADVEQWVIDQDGTIYVYYQGNPKPYKQEIPPRAGQNGQDRLAWAVEAPARALGSAIQRGRRITAPFVRHEPPAYSDANPYAPAHQTVSGVKKREEDPFTIANKAKRLGAAITPRSQKILQQQGYLKGDVIEPGKFL